MIKHLLIILLFTFFALNSFSQNYGNEWINYSQEYYKIKIAENGVYRIPRTILENAKFPIYQIPLANIQLFSKGKEQAIYIKQSSLGIIDYIEFYGEKNTGWLDSAFYENQNDQLNPNYSLVNDTNVYYLTWNSSTTNKRFTEINETNFSGYTPTLYCNYNSFAQYIDGEYYTTESVANYSAAEGWFGAKFGLNETNIKTITTKNAYTSGPNAKVEIAVATESNASSISSYNHHLKISSSNFDFDTLTKGYTNIKKQFQFSSSKLTDKIQITFTPINDLAAVTDYNAVSYINVNYPRTFNFENLSYVQFQLPSNTTKSYLEIKDFTADNGAILYNLTNNQRINVVKETSIFKTLVPILQNESNFILCSNDAVKFIDKITAVNSDVSNYAKFTNYIDNNVNTSYLIITNKKLFSEATNYKNYRNSTGYNVCVADVDQLYDQYAYGIVKHPLAIRNFVRQTIQNWTSLDYLLLLGKSVSTHYHRKNDNNYITNLVPSYGYPSNDNYLIEGINTTKFHLPISIGRVSAQNTSEANLYLSKVIEFEYNSPAKWMKNIIHFGGGNDVYEQTTFASYLENYKNTIEDTLFAGKVTTLLKNSSDPIQITQTDTVKNLINNGVSLITFFGHGYTGGFDQNIDDPESFNNKGKYPFLLANSCLTGDVHIPSKSISERWVLVKDKGSIGFIASVSYGNSYFLNKFSDEFYKHLSYKSYGKSIGECIKNTDNILSGSNETNVSLIEACLQFNLHGDPAIKLNSPLKPDLTIENADVSFNPSAITTNTEEFDININISNIGKATTDSFIVSISRKYPDGSIENNNYVVQKCVGSEKLTVTMPVNQLKAGGVNEFSFKLDIMQQIEELSELNNNLTLNIIISSDDVSPIYPYNYAIIPDSIVTLKASVANPFINNNDYIFEIDTTDLFNSPFLKSSKLYEAGGILEWTLPFTLSDSTVYFWRVSKIPTVVGTNKWKESSFIYIKNQIGWSQAHFFQFKNDEYNLLEYNRAQRKFEYITIAKELVARNIGLAWGEDQWQRVNYFLDGVGMTSSCGTTHSMLVAVIDPLTLTAWKSTRGNYGQRNYLDCERNGFIFTSDSISREKMISFFKNIVPSNFYVLMYSFISGHFQEWSNNQYQYFDNIGATHLRNVPNNFPYILFFQKDNLLSVNEVFGTNDHDEINFSKKFDEKYYYGEITSEKFGPSTKWNTLRWNQKSSEQFSTDESTLSVFGVEQNGEETELYKDLTQNDTLVYNLDNVIDAQTYPYVKLKLKTKDEVTFTPAQLKKWQLLSEQAPETALNIEKGFYFYNDTVLEGEDVLFSIATENIGEYDMDSLLIRYSLQDKNNNLTLIKDIRKRKHPAADILKDTLTFSTEGLSGLNSIWVEVNPINNETGFYDQIEQYHFNNIAQKYFYVNNDITNPLLDVTFDGVHIINGEIIPSKPQIVISLNDENKFLALNDTSIFAVYLKSMTDNIEHKIYFKNSSGNDVMQWIPASLPKNSCKIIYNPELEDGKYELRIQARDVSNNNSGDNDYKISFEVIAKSTITNIYNYPNPFSTSTRFVFTLTGNEIPDVFNIDIYTITGKLVKQITINDLNDIHIGNNITNFRWDGTDMYGDKLANGVYYYKVNIQINGNNLEKRTTNSDALFKNSIGKLYIMR